MRKNSQYTKFFSTVLFDIVSSGQWNFIQNRESVATTSCKSSSDLEIEPIGFEKLAFIFFILVSGIIFSLVIILMEFKIPKRIYSKMIHQDTGEKCQEKLKKRIQKLLKDLPKIQREYILLDLLLDDDIWE